MKPGDSYPIITPGLYLLAYVTRKPGDTHPASLSMVLFLFDWKLKKNRRCLLYRQNYHLLDGCLLWRMFNENQNMITPSTHMYSFLSLLVHENQVLLTKLTFLISLLWQKLPWILLTLWTLLVSFLWRMLHGNRETITPSTHLALKS